MSPDLKKWEEQAKALGPDTKNPLDIPYPIAIEEATSVAGFIEKYQEAKNGLPGLGRVAKRLPPSTKDDILSLVATIQLAQTKYLLLVDPNVPKLGPRANYVINQLAAVLEFVLDDGVEEPEDEQLDNVKDFHSQNSQRSTALAQSLKNFAALAATLKDRIQQEDTEFDLSLIDEANSLALQLSEKVVADASKTNEAGSLLLLRNQLLTLLMQLVKSTRKTAAYVFAEHPAIIREVTSAYERQRRARARLEAKAQGISA